MPTKNRKAAKHPVPGDTFSYWLGLACRRLRRRHELSQKDVAAFGVVGQSALSEFEQGRWPKRPELAVQAYALACGVEDCRDIWQAGLDLWREEGDLPGMGRTNNDGRGTAERADR